MSEAPAVTPQIDDPLPQADRSGSTLAWVSRYGVYVALALLVVGNALFTDNFLSETVLRLQIIQAVPVLIVALGMAVVIGTEGIDLSVGAVMALAAAVMPLYIGYGTGVSVVLGLLCGVLTGAVAGFLVGKIGVQPIIATLGLMVAGRGLAQLVGGEIKTLTDPGLISLGVDEIGPLPYTVLIAIVCACLVGWLMRRTTFGRHVLAVGGNKRAAELAGVPTARVLLGVYVLGGVLAALAGVLAAARAQSSDPTQLGMLMELQAITAVVVGGTPLTGGRVRVLGTVAGALVLQLITATLIAHDIADSSAQMIQAGIVIVAVYIQTGRRAS